MQYEKSGGDLFARQPDSLSFPAATAGGLGVEQTNNPPSTPKDARKATAEQQELQAKLDRQNDDPDAPGRHQNRDTVADET
jgi:hypothetical protein